MKNSENEKTWNFDNWANRYDQVVASDSQHYYAQYDQVLDKVVEMASLTPGNRVLDIGTGTGPREELFSCWVDESHGRSKALTRYNVTPRARV